MKKTLSILLAALLAAVLLAVPVCAYTEVETTDYDYTRFKDANITLNVYNWGEYISDGSDDTLDINKAFEELTGITVKYSTFDTNESLYAKLKSGGADYDIIIPSDYMIGKMINEGMLEKLDYTNIPNYSMIGEAYKGLDYDATSEYSVPYTWGVVGIVYNTTMVDETVDSWDMLWNSKYAGEILMFNNSRDAFAIASKKLNMSLNPTSTEDIAMAAKELKTQRDVVQAYVMDEIFDKMGGGEAALAPYYAGDAITMISDNPDLAFAIPKEGTNYFVDAMCIPKGSVNKEAAEMYINFMCETEVALANTEYIGYSTPQTEAQKLLPEELKNSPIMYPSEDVLAKTETFNVLPDELNAAMDKAWSDIKTYEKNGNSYLFIVVLLAIIAAVIFMTWRKAVKKKRDQY
ncbi:MAG: spermidine/putrescine ABC transporter substrate-binding protein [Oscillospiraceae bacterium]|nr:spermidine/putrescine ABC transporter substrate-binding protein [Oscillospiraceae bacterium]